MKTRDFWEGLVVGTLLLMFLIFMFEGLVGGDASPNFPYSKFHNSDLLSSLNMI